MHDLLNTRPTIAVAGLVMFPLILSQLILLGAALTATNPVAGQESRHWPTT